MFLHDVVGRKALERCGADISIRAAARSMLTTGSDAIAVIDGDQRLLGALTPIRARLRPRATARPTSQSPACCRALHRRRIVPRHRRHVGARRNRGRRAGGDVGRLLERPAADAPDVEDIARVLGDQPVSILREIRSRPIHAGTARAELPRAHSPSASPAPPRSTGWHASSRWPTRRS